MDPMTMTIAALVQAAIGLAGGIQKGVASARQNKMAKAYGKTKRPDYQIPPSLQKATDMAKANLNPPVNTQLLQEIGAGTAGTINRAAKIGTSTADMLAASGNAVAQENAAKRALFADNQGRKDAMLGQYMNMLQTMGGQENKAWEWNKAQPYMNAQEAAQALHQSSAQNAAGAIGDIAAGGAAGVNSLMQGKQMDLQKDQMQKMIDLLLGKKTDAAKKTLGGDNIESLGQKGLPELSKIVKPDTDPNAPYKPNAADLLGFSKDLPLPKNTHNNIPQQIEALRGNMDIKAKNTKQSTPDGYIEWKNKLPTNLQNESDYDLQQLYKENPSITPSENMHFPDKYKKPNHMTFSNESMYSKGRVVGGVWDNINGVDRFTPSEYNLLQHTPEEMKAYFDNNEKGVILNLPTTPIQNTNIPTAQRIAEKPTAPLIATTTTGKVLENGKPKYDFSDKTTEELQNRLSELEAKKYGFAGKSTKQLQDRLNQLQNSLMYQNLISNPELLKMFLK